MALTIPLLASGCLSPDGGPACIYWFAPPKPKITGDGSSLQSPLHIKHASKDSLEAIEASWFFRWYGGPYEIMDSKFYERLQLKTERVGKRVYDIGRLVMADGTVRVAYFDVTIYRQGWPGAADK